MSLKCPHCGGAIEPQISLNLPSISTAISGIEGKGLDLEPQELSQDKKRYNQGYHAQFLEFWAVYPLHRGKRPAQKAWLKAYAKLGSNPEAISILISGAIRYRDDPNRDPSKTKYAEGWLNDERWEDEPISPNGKASSGIYAALGVSRDD